VSGITKQGDINFESVVKLAERLNGVDMRNACTEVSLFAIQSDRTYVLEEDFMKAPTRFWTTRNWNPFWIMARHKKTNN
jgi:ATP-dependent 26S proteasome regulatory subunit